MKAPVLATIALAATAGLFSFTTDKAAKDASYVVDAQKSKLEWNGKKVSGEHSGLVPVKTGTLVWNGNKLKGGQFEISVKDLTVTDIKDQEYNTKLVGHLKNDDFFSTEKFPTAKLVITSVKPEAGNKYSVTGNLTIKGITQPVTFPAEASVNGKTVTAKAKISVDRTKYDIKYNSKSFFSSIGDKAIYDDFTLDVALVGTQK